MQYIVQPYSGPTFNSLFITLIVDGCTEEDKSKKCNHTREGSSFSFVRALVILILTLIVHFLHQTYIGQNIGYRSTWSVNIVIGIALEKRISVDP